MKKILLALMVAVSLMPAMLKAQSTTPTTSFTVAHDTVFMNVITSADSNDLITNITGDTLILKWRVVSAPTFPPDWYTATALSICDDASCRDNTGGVLWNGTTGNMFSSTYPPNATHDTVEAFGFFPDLTGASGGTRAITINIADSTRGKSSYGFSKQIVFMVTHPGVPTAVSSIVNTDNNVALYPNPAKDELNIVYSPAADVKTITVYNIIGKIMAVYKVSNPAGANLNIENMPSGIYFVRLVNSNGEQVTTRRFTKQ